MWGISVSEPNFRFFYFTILSKVNLISTQIFQSNLGSLHPQDIFMGVKLFIGTPKMPKEGVLKTNGMGYVKMHGFHGIL